MTFWHQGKIGAEPLPQPCAADIWRLIHAAS